MMAMSGTVTFSHLICDVIYLVFAGDVMCVGSVVGGDHV